MSFIGPCVANPREVFSLRDAAPITLGRFTHVLPGELERARDQLQRFLDEREAEEAGQSFKVAVAAR